MTLKKLRQYRSICAEIKELEIEMKKNTQNVTVKGSDNFFPYISHTMSVSGLKGTKEDNKLRNDLYALRLQKKEIEDYINSIEDILTYRIFKYRFLRGYSWDEVSRIIGSSKDSVKKVCYRYLKKSSN